MARPIDPRSRRIHRTIYGGVAIAIAAGIIWMLTIQAQTLDGTITLSEMSKNLGQDPYNIIVLDTRPHEAWTAGHVPYAISIPLEQLGRRLGDLSQGRDRQIAIIDDTEAREQTAQKILAQDGFKSVVRAPEGMGGWRAQNRKLDTENNAPIHPMVQ